MLNYIELKIKTCFKNNSDDDSKSPYEKFEERRRELGNTSRKAGESNEDYHRRVNGADGWYEDY